MSEWRDTATVFVGVDWATQEHEACAVDHTGKVLGHRSFRNTGDGLADLKAWVSDWARGANLESVGVAIEVPHGPVVETLLEAKMAVFAINPKQLDRFRDRFSPAGAKDDRRDARVLADSLRTDTRCFRALKVADPAIILLREWSRMAEEIQQERIRLANRLREQLRRYFPQLIELSEDVLAEWFLELWRLASTPAAARDTTVAAVAELLKTHRIRKHSADKVIEVLRANPVVVAEGTTEAAVDHINLIVPRARLLNHQLSLARGQLDTLTRSLAEPVSDLIPETDKKEQHDADILRSLPGVGRIVLATLLTEASQPLQERDYQALRTLSGVAPVTRRSGKSCTVGMRSACSHRLRNAVYHWARVATVHDPRSKERYRALRQRGQTHGRALRTVADRLLAVACAMLRSRTLFDSARPKLGAAQESGTST